MLQGLLHRCTDADIEANFIAHPRRLGGRVCALLPAPLPAAPATEEHRSRDEPAAVRESLTDCERLRAPSTWARSIQHSFRLNG